MALTDTLVPVPLTGGVDLRSDRFAVQPPKTLIADNVTFDSPGALTKRPGTTVLASQAFPMGDVFRGVAVRGAVDGSQNIRGQELVSWDGYDIYTGEGFGGAAQPPSRIGRSSTLVGLGRYSKAAAAHMSMRRTVSLTVGSSIVFADCATAKISGTTVHVVQTAGGNCYWWAVSANGAVLKVPTTLAGTRPRVVCLTASDTFLLLYLSGTTLRVYAFTDPYGVTGVGTGIIADAAGSYDIEADALSFSKGIIGWVSTTALTVKWANISAAGALSGTVTQATAAAPNLVAIATHRTDGRVAIAWGTSTPTVIVRTFTAAGAAITAVQTLSSSKLAVQLTVCLFSDPFTPGSFFVRGFFAIAGASNYLDAVYTNDTQLFSEQILSLHSGLASKAWSRFVDSATSVVVSHTSTLQKTYFVMRYVGNELASSIMARLSPGDAIGHASAIGGHLSGVQRLDETTTGGRFRWAGGDQDQPAEYTLDDKQPVRWVGLDNVLYWAGGYLGQYDGERALENGFFLFPEDITATPSSAGGGMTGGGTYAYRWYFERNTRAGRERSAAVTITVTLGAGDNRVSFTIPTLAHTLDQTNGTDQGVRVVGYRTLNGGAVAHLVGSVLNDGTTDTVSFIDTLADTAIAAAESDYRSSVPAELQHDSPLCCTVIAEVNGRLFVAGGLDPNLVQFSLERQSGEPVTFAGENQIVVQSGEGPITGLAALNNALIVFRRNSVYVVAGPGPNNTGSGGEFAQPAVISTEQGCIRPGSICRIPQGIIFQGTGGLFLLGNDLQVSNVGADIEPLVGLSPFDGSDDILSAVAWPRRGEVRLGLGSNNSDIPIMNYRKGMQWSLERHNGSPGCQAAVIYNDLYVRVDSAGDNLIASNPALSPVDVDAVGASAAYSQAVTSAWIHLHQSIQGYQRVRAILFAGTYRGPHKPVVKICYDGNDNVVDTLTWTATSSGGFWQFEVRPSRARCRAIQIRIEDAVDSGTLAASFSLSEMAIRVAVRDTNTPVAAAKRAV